MFWKISGVALLLASLACAGSNEPAPSPEPAAKTKVRLDATAKTVTIKGLTVTRPEGWQFVTADRSLSEDAELMMVGPAKGPQRPSVTVYRRELSARERRAAPDALLTVFAMENMQMMESFELDQEPVFSEIAGHPGASMKVKAAAMNLNGSDATPVDGRFYAIIDGANFWTVMAIVPNGGASGDVDSVIDSIRL
ncbi:MAG: hypothetical protein AAFQ82_09180 [Myxococcota bacterium]